MLRITKPTRSAAAPAVVLEGSLVGPWVGELRRLAAEDGGQPLRLDLGGLAFADAEGIALLRELDGRGFELWEASSFLAALLGEDDGGKRDVG